MKKLNTLTYFLGAVLLGSAITACDKFEDDVPPARMTELKLNDDAYTTNKNQRVALNVLANDTIGSAATVQFSPPQHGSLQPDSLGTMYYYPGSNFVGTDAFTYKACLGNDCATANVTITVKQDSTSTGCTIQAFNDIRTLKQNYADTLNVLLNDNLCGISPSVNNATITIINPPKHGGTFHQAWDNRIYYFPNVNYVGTDEYTYQVTTSKGTATAKVIYNIVSNPQTCRVVAMPDSARTIPVFGTTQDSVTVKVGLNDYICPGAGPATITLPTTHTAYGSLILYNTGLNTRIIYVTNQNAPASYHEYFTYRLCQGNNCSDAKVLIMRR